MIPTGGSVPLGAAAYVAMVAELFGKLMDAGEAPRRLYVATGSQGTQAGLVVGARAFSAPFAVKGIAVEHPIEKLDRRLHALANGTAELIGLEQWFAERDVDIDGGFVGRPMAWPTSDGLEAIRLLAQTEAIFLDPVYSGKAMAALLSHFVPGRSTSATRSCSCTLVAALRCFRSARISSEGAKIAKADRHEGGAIFVSSQRPRQRKPVALLDSRQETTLVA